MREIVLDTETTGLDPEAGHRVVEIGCIELVNHLQTGRHFRVYLNPERDMPEEAFRVHGLSAEFLADKPRFAAVAEEFLGFIEDSPLVIHNAEFCLRFLDAELKRLGRPGLERGRAIDTVHLARRVFPGGTANLRSLVEKLGLAHEERDEGHCMQDAVLTGEVYRELITMIRPRERESLECELLNAWEASSEGRGFVRDGILDHIAYDASPLRTVFLLKEANNDDGESFSLSDVVFKEDRWQAWSNLARWCAEILALAGDGIQLGEGPIDVEMRRTLLRPFAFINLKKVPGGPVARINRIQDYARANRDFIRQQLVICNPDLVVCCGDDVWDVLTSHVLPEEAKSRVGEVRINSEASAGTLPSGAALLSYWHPQPRRSPGTAFLREKFRESIETLIREGRVKLRTGFRKREA